MLSNVDVVPQLEPLCAGQSSALLAFELSNRAYFARSISDRGDAFFEHFADQLAARLSEQAAEEGAFYVLTEADGSIVGRVNLTLTGDGEAWLGYRLAEAVTGRGLATTAVRELCALAGRAHGVERVRAATSMENIASQRVLAKAGFTLLGPADPSRVGGKPGFAFERLLSMG